MKLYGYWRSSAAYRLRIAFGLKGLSWDDVPVHLVKGEQRRPDYVEMNPIGLVPTVVLDDGTRLTQSLAILDWVEATHPKPALWPKGAVMRARVTAAGHVIAVDTHPVQNSGVVSHLKSAFDTDTQGGIDWMVHWMQRGFSAYQAMIDPGSPFSFGDHPTFADICLIPQLYNAHRWGVDLGPYARLTQIEAKCLALPAFNAARPENQPDAE
jgi:maleylacetoacetate isomerase